MFQFPQLYPLQGKHVRKYFAYNRREEAFVFPMTVLKVSC